MISRKDERKNQEEKKRKTTEERKKSKQKEKKTDDGKKKNLRNRALSSPENKISYSFPLPGCALIVTLNKVTILRPPFSFLRLQYLKTKFLKVLQACYLLF
jgi:hypothetical protein